MVAETTWWGIDIWLSERLKKTYGKTFSIKCAKGTPGSVMATVARGHGVNPGCVEPDPVLGALH
jgi:hypothetical protein